MTSEEIIKYVLPDIIEKIKNPNKEKKKENDLLDDAPEFYPNYRKIITDYNNIRVHAVKHVFPAKLLSNRSPNATLEEWDYVKKNLKKITLPVFVDFINLIQRAFFDQNYSIDYSNQKEYQNKEDSFEWYLKNYICEYGSIDGWLKALPSIKIIDAMGVIAIRPEEPEMKEVDGQQIIDDTALPNPQPYYYPCDKVLSYDEDEYYLILTERYSYVKNGKTNEKCGLIFELYDKEKIWFITQVGKKSDYTFEIEDFFTHGMGYPPVKRLDGVTVIEEGRPYKQSPFLYATDNLDLVLLNASNLQLAVNNCVYPIKVVKGNPCDFISPEGLKCHEGMILDPATRTRKVCGACGGAGLKQRTSPIGAYLVKSKTSTTEAESIDEAIKYISPEVSSLEFLEKRIATDEKRARSILHLKSTQETGTGENPNESLEQAKSTITFIKPISDQIFDTLEFTVDSMRKQRYGVDTKIPNPEIMRPTSFELLTHQDYLNEISEAIKNKLPGIVINAAIDRYISSLYRNEKEKLRVYKLLLATDRLLMNTEDEISAKIASRTADVWEEVLHSSGLVLIQEAETADVNFWEKDLEAQKKIIIDKAKAKALELPQAPKVPQFNGFPQ